MMFFPIVHRPGLHTHAHTHVHIARAHLLRPILDSVQNRLAKKSSFVHEVWASLVIPVCKQWPTEWSFETLHGLDRVKEASVCTYVFHLSRITITWSFYHDAWHHESANVNGRQDDFAISTSIIYFFKNKLLLIC